MVDATGSSRALKTEEVAVYFTDDTGVRYRVYDTTYSAGKHHRRPTGDPTATARVFVPPTKEQLLRAYTFKKGESRRARTAGTSASASGVTVRVADAALVNDEAASECSGAQTRTSEERTTGGVGHSSPPLAAWKDAASAPLGGDVHQ